MALDLEMERQLAARAVKNRDEAWDDMNVPYKMKEHYHGRKNKGDDRSGDAGAGHAGLQ